tara:strand:+ start:1781 stop:2491 length:711 start_codon:yes stop_codon:yes gene_type:complete
MASFGWAYINCSDSAGTADGSGSGPTGSLQFIGDSIGHTTGSAFLMYYTSSVAGNPPNSLVLSGNMVITGALSASVFNYQNISVIDATGSTYFGNTNDDTHRRIGSLVVRNAAGLPTLSASVTTENVHVRGLSVLYEFVASTSNPIAVYTASAPSYIIGVRSTGSVQVEIPHPGTAYSSGSLLVFKDEVGHLNGTSIRLSAAAGDTYYIDGAGSYTLTGSNPAISLYSNGANWFVF